MKEGRDDKVGSGYSLGAPEPGFARASREKWAKIVARLSQKDIGKIELEKLQSTEIKDLNQFLSCVVEHRLANTLVNFIKLNIIKEVNQLIEGTNKFIEKVNQLELLLLQELLMSPYIRSYQPIVGLIIKSSKTLSETVSSPILNLYAQRERSHEYAGLFSLELLEPIISLKAEDQEGNSLLHWVAKYGTTEMVERLSKRGDDPHKFIDANIVNDDGLTPMHFAAYAGRVDVIQILSDNKGDLDAPDNNGRTPMHYAALGNHKPTITRLRRLGASAMLKDNKGFTALQLLEKFDSTSTEQSKVQSTATAKISEEVNAAADQRVLSAEINNQMNILNSIQEIKRHIITIDLIEDAPTVKKPKRTIER